MTQPTDIIEVTTATETEAQAVDLAGLAVRARLAAGGQVTGPVTSVFWHLGEFGTGQEWRLSLRTHRSRFEDLAALLAEHHPWRNPEIAAFPLAAGSDGYLAWVRDTVAAEVGGTP